MICNKGSNGNIKPSIPRASHRARPLPAAPLATSVIQSQGVRTCSRAHQHMESRSLLKVIVRRLCSLLAGLCALSSRSDGCWMFRLVVTASPWDQGDLWPLRNGQTWKQKQRPFVQVKGKTSAEDEDEEERVRGALTLEELSFGLFRHLWWEVATVHFIIMTLILFISLIGRILAQQKKKWLRNTEEFLWCQRCCRPYRITTGADGCSSSFIFKLNWSLNKWFKRIPDHGVNWREHRQTALALIASCIVMINECLNCLILQGRVQYHLNLAAGMGPTQEAKHNKRNTLGALNANTADI